MSDLSMPGEDGCWLIRRIREHVSPLVAHLPAVVLTALTRPADRRRAILAGFQMHVSKPVEVAELIAAIANLTGGVRMPELAAMPVGSGPLRDVGV